MAEEHDESLYAISFDDEEEEEEEPHALPMEDSVQAVEVATAAEPTSHPRGYRSHSVSHDRSSGTSSHISLVKSQSFHGKAADDPRRFSTIKSSSDLIWLQQFDPRTKSFYYINATTGETTTVKPRFVSKAKARDPSHAAALVIQCAARSRRARRRVQSLRASTPPSSHAASYGTAQVDVPAILHEAYVRKCRLVGVLLDDLSLAITTRHVIATPEDAELATPLAQLHAEFKETWTQIKGTFEAAKLVVDDPASLLHLRSEDLIATLSQVRKGCLQLRRTIASHDAAFLSLDVFRVNKAWHRFTRWNVPPQNDGALHKAHLRVEGQLRKALGAAAFHNHADLTDLPPTRTFSEWHGSVVTLLASVAAYETLVAIDANNDKDNKASAHAPQDDEQSALAPQPQDTLAHHRSPPKRQHRTKSTMDLAELRQCWIDGLKLREADEAAAAQEEKDAVRARAVERIALRSAQEKHRNDRSKRKLTIWEAVIEGLPVEKINQLAVAETKKAAQSGHGAFRLRDSQAENGRTLLQLACWSGHVHLVRYFVEKGSNLGQFDCVNNRFSLLHDAARAGRTEVVRVLLEYGLPCNILDNYGDNPVHWAARRNHIETIQVLLDLPLKQVPTAASTISTAQITRWRSVLATNHRGKRPAHLTTLHCIRAILLDFERVAEAGLELYNRQGASEAAMLKRRAGLAPPTLKRTTTMSGGASRGMARQQSRADVADSTPSPRAKPTDPPPVDGRRYKEFRVKKATARAVKNFEKEGQKRATVQLAGQMFKHTLQPTASAFSIEADDMDIFLDHVE